MSEFPLSPFPTADDVCRHEQRRRLTRLALVCAVALAVAGLSVTVDDVAIAGASGDSFDRSAS